MSDCSFTPTEQGPLKVIVDMHDSEYTRMRAIELIHESKLHALGNTQLRLAISLLALTIAERENGTTEEKR